MRQHVASEEGAVD